MTSAKGVINAEIAEFTEERSRPTPEALAPGLTG
jgi:hypothetical protein